MSQAPALDWAILAVSLFNTIVLLWLGLTVLLNARRKSWGVWLAGGGLLLGATFFISHTAILGRGLQATGQGMNFWWYVGWGTVIASPWLWYVVMLWYAGYWQDPRSDLRRRQRVWFPLASVLSISLVLLLLFVYPLPSFGQATALDLSAAPSVAGVPVLLLIYPGYTLLCIALSLHALRYSPSPGKGMLDRARQRARPWLLASTVLLLLVSLLVAWAMAWIVANARQGGVGSIDPTLSVTLAGFDLAISSLIALAVACLGQAIVAYEIFTGETLPRRGFTRQWRNALILAAGYGIVVGASLAISLRSIYVLLLTTVLMVTFYALSGWRSFAERERYIAHLRPFVSSQRLYDAMLAPSARAIDVDVSGLFDALCQDVLAVQRGYLIALGPLAPLIGSALAFPGGELLPALPVSEIAAQFDSPQTVGVPLDAARWEGLVWAVSLWSERGLIGVLLLGEKREGGLYTQEEIEIARASGERLIDTLATAQVSARLMALLRQRIAQVRVMEGQGRRVLHDQVLPQLHAAILKLGALPGEPAVQQAVGALTQAHRQISDLMYDSASAAPRRLAQRGLIAALRASVESDFEGAFDRVAWHSSPGAVQAVGRLPLYVTEVLFFAAQELIRNAARHGRGKDPQRALCLAVVLDESSLAIEDDGVGFGAVSPAEEKAHNGLRFHSTMLAAVGGSLEITALPGQGTRATIHFPQA
jgi:signal transduction histidine kinase